MVVFEQAYLDQVAAVIEEYGGYILNTARFFLRDGDKAQDVLQTVSLKVLENLRLFRGDNGCSIQTWLSHIVHNECINFIEREHKGRLCQLGRLEMGYFDKMMAPSRNESSVEKMILVRELLELMDKDLKVPFLLHHQKGLTLKEVSEILGVPNGTAHTWVFRACQSVRKYI